VYDYTSGELLYYFSASQTDLRSVSIKWATLISNIQNRLLVKENLVLSFNSLTLPEIKAYVDPFSIKAKSRVKGYKIQMVEVLSNQIVCEFSSIREAAREFKAAQTTISQSVNLGVVFRDK